MLFENSKPETLTHLHPRLDRRNLTRIHLRKAETSVEYCQCDIVANTNVTNYQLDFGKNVRNVGFVEGRKSETFAAEVFERRADKIKLLAVDDQKTVMKYHACLD